MKVGCNAFNDFEMIPKKYTGYGEDLSPELILSDVPEDAVSLAIILDDLDVPFRKSYNHGVIGNIPNIEIIPEGLPKGGEITNPIKASQGIGGGRNIYRGPKPPFFLKKAHRYVFCVYALDSELSLPVTSNKKVLLDAMKGHVLAESTLTGLYKNK